MTGVMTRAKIVVAALVGCAAVAAVGLRADPVRALLDRLDEEWLTITIVWKPSPREITITRGIGDASGGSLTSDHRSSPFVWRVSRDRETRVFVQFYQPDVGTTKCLVTYGQEELDYVERDRPGSARCGNPPRHGPRG